jgi:hypothetical protein
MLPLTESEISALRQLQIETLTVSCTRVRDILESDGKGGRRKTGEDTVTYPCRVAQIRNPFEMVFLREDRLRVQYIITLPWYADVQRGDRIIVGDRRFGVVATYGVPTFYGPSAMQCYCEELL